MAFYQPQKSGLNNKYYPAAVLIKDSAEVKLVAEKCAALSGVHLADIVSVLGVLPEVMADLMNEGRSVHLPNLGYFRYTIDAKEGGRDTADEVTEADIKKANVVFRPEKSYTKANGAGMTRSLVPNSTDWVRWYGKPVADASDTPAADTPAADTPQTGGSDDQQQDPMG